MTGSSFEERLRQLQGSIGYEFRDEGLLRQALVHRSYAHENHAERHNEPLEFLGDAVLGFLVAERIFRRRPDLDEGGMTRLRAKLVNTHSLAAAARSLDLGDCLFLGRGEERSGGRRKPSLLADGFEALVGALFLDGGIRAARRFVWNVVTEGIDASLDGVRARSLDPKTALQEHAQGRGWALPVYRIADAEGPDHARRYRVEVLIEGEVMGEGRGSSKKRGEQAAASAALARLERSEDEDERER